MVEQRFCKAKAIGSNPLAGSWQITPLAGHSAHRHAGNLEQHLPGVLPPHGRIWSGRSVVHPLPFPFWSLLGLIALIVQVEATRAVHAQGASPVATPAVRPSDASGKPATAGGSQTSAKEQVLLERIRQLKTPRWKSFGSCRYDWSAWRVAEGGVRTTTSICGAPEITSKVAVHCDTLRVSHQGAQGAWGEWRLPLSQDESKSQGGEDLMVANLCANAKPIPATPAAPAAGPAKGGTSSPRTQTP